ncbi:MAG: alpha/beta hydrolase [Bacteroidota bacterium]
MKILFGTSYYDQSYRYSYGTINRQVCKREWLENVLRNTRQWLPAGIDTWRCSTIGTTFGRILPALSKTHKVIAVELQAHGHTADIDRPLSFEQDANDVVELLKQLHIPKADIFGFSNGASTTLEIAIRFPELVNKIIVASTMYKKAGAYHWFWDMMAHATFEGMPQGLKDAYLQINPDTNALYTMYERDVARMQSFTDMQEEDIKAITAPALIIAANNDVVTPGTRGRNVSPDAACAVSDIPGRSWRLYG